MNKSYAPKVSLATNRDINGILFIQKQNLLKNKKDNEIDKGFLVHPVLKKDLVEIINNPDSHILFVAKEENNVQGYILGYDLNLWKRQKPDWEASLEVSNGIRKIIRREKILYMRHIAKRLGVDRIGSILFNKILEEAVARGYSYVIAEILQEPYKNIASTYFAEKFGLTMIGKIHDSNEYIWGLFMKKL